MLQYPKDFRPHLGPLLYGGPASCWSPWHQDGHGAIDACHVMVAGTKEFILTGPLPMEKFSLIYSLMGYVHTDQWMHSKQNFTMHSMFSSDLVARLRNELETSVHLITLEAGDMLFIHRGRAHTARVASMEHVLPTTDAFCYIRQTALAEESATLYKNYIAIGLAWDMYVICHTKPACNN